MRHDADTIKSIELNIGKEEARSLQQLPFIMAPLKFERPGDTTPEYPKEYLLSHEDTLNTIPFEEFSFFRADSATYLHVVYDGDCKWTVTMMPAIALLNADNEKKTKRVKEVYKKLAYSVAIFTIKQVLRTPTDDDPNCLSMDYAMQQEWFVRKKRLTIPAEELDYEDLQSMFDEHANFMFSFFGYAANSHLVRVEKKETRKKRKTTPYLRTHPHAECHYIYLDAPPSHHLSQAQKDHDVSSSKRGHHRKAHWRSLTHQRFVNHPKFGQRVRVRAAWIGPHEWADTGKIYTIHNQEPKNNDKSV